MDDKTNNLDPNTDNSGTPGAPDANHAAGPDNQPQYGAEPQPNQFTQPQVQQTPPTYSASPNDTEPQSTADVANQAPAGPNPGVFASAQTVPPNQPFASSPEPVIPDQAPSNQYPQTPVAEKPKAGITNKLLLIIGPLIGLAVAAGLVVFAFSSMQLSPEERFAKAIINSASTNSLKQAYTITGDISATFDFEAQIDAHTDFTDPATPKSKIQLYYVLTNDGNETVLDAEYICLSQTDCYSKFNNTESSEDTESPLGVVYDKWQQFNPFEPSLTNRLLAPIESINTPLGEVLNGNISGETKSLIEQIAKDDSTYIINSSNEQELDGAKVVKYEVSLNYDKIKELNDVAQKQYNLEYEFSVDNKPETVTIYVDKSNNQIVRVEFFEEDAASIVTYSEFDRDVSIEAPEF